MGKKKGAVRVKQVGPKMPSAAVNPMDAFQIPNDEMIRLPVPPDRSYQVFWPMHEAFTMNITGFQIIYPSYMDSKKTMAHGRRVPLNVAIPTPTALDLSHALSALQIRHVVQPYKGYSRDITCQWENPGRVKVDVSRYKKKELMHELCKIIPTLPERITRIAQEEAEQKAKEEEMAAAQRVEAADPQRKAITMGAGSTKKQAKKGKKK